MSNQTKHTAGAIRAGQRISAILKHYFHLLLPSNADTLAAIIDRETSSPELLEQVRFCCEQLRECMEQNHGQVWANANTVVANAENVLARAEGRTP